jgi:hypothetical protein
MGEQNIRSVRDMFPVLMRWNALTPSLRTTPLPRAFMGGQKMYVPVQLFRIGTAQACG